MSVKSEFVSELDEQIAALAEHYAGPARSETQARTHAKLAVKCQSLSEAAAAEDYKSASVHAGWIRHISMDSLSMSSPKYSI